MKNILNFFILMLFFLGAFILSQENNEVAGEKEESPVLKILHLKKDETAIPTILEIVAASPTQETVQTAAGFFLEMDPKLEGIVAGFLELAFHSNTDVANFTQSMFNKAKEDWIFAIRDLLKNGTVEEKNKAAILLTKHNADEIDTFAELLESNDAIDQQIAITQLKELSKLHTILIIQRLIELAEINPNPKLSENIQNLLKFVGKKNVNSMILVLKETSSEFGRNLLIQILESFGEDFVIPAIETLQNNLDLEIKELVKKIFKKMGVKIIPNILNSLADRRPLVHSLIEEVIKSFGSNAVKELTNILENGTRDEQKLAFEALAILGTDAKESFPVIKPFLSKKNDLQYPALYALSMMGDASKDAVEDLKMVVKVAGRDYLIRSTAADCLANAGIAAQEALPVFLERLKWENEDFKEQIPEVRKSICDAIGNIGSGAIKAVPTLVLCVSKDTDESVVRAAADAIGKIASKVEGSPKELQDSVDPLVEVFINYGPKEMQAAAIALAQIAKSNSNILNNKLLRMLQTNRNSSIRLGVAITFKYIGKNAQLLLAKLSSAARTDESDLVRQELALAFAEIGPFPESIRTLVEMVRDESTLVRNAAIKSLGKMGPQAVGYITLALNRYNNDAYRILYLQALSNLGPHAISSLNNVMGFLNSSNSSLQKEAIRTLGNMGTEAIKNNSTVLSKILQVTKQSNDPEVYELTKVALIQFGPQVFSDVLELLKEPNQQVQQLAISVLDKFSGGNLEELTKVILEGQDPFLVAQLIPIIGKNNITLDILLKKLDDPNTVVKNSLIDTISRMGTPAIPKLLNILLNSENEESCNTVSRILAKIGNSAVLSLLNSLKTVPPQNKLAQRSLIKTLGDMGIKAQKAILPLIDYLKLWKGEERIFVARNLGKIGVPAIPYLVRLLSNPDKSIQQAAIVALEETKSPIAIEYLLKTLKDPHWLSQVITACTKMKNIAPPVLINFLNDSNEYIRFACAASLMEIGEAKALDALQKQEAAENNDMIKYILQKSIERIQEKK